MKPKALSDGHVLCPSDVCLGYTRPAEWRGFLFPAFSAQQPMKFQTIIVITKGWTFVRVTATTAMPEEFGNILSKSDLRNLLEFLLRLK